MSSRFNWYCFAAVLALALGFVGTSAWVRTQTMDQISAALAGSDEAIVGRNRLVPSSAEDGLFWISYAQQMAATGELRVRHTDIDNAPYGREVHWSSGFAWWLVGLGRLRQAFTHEPLAQAIEYAAALANPLLMMFALVAFGGIGAWRYGPVAGLALIAALVSLPGIMQSFAVNEPDHHGLINVAALGTVLGLVAGGFGWEQSDPHETRGWLPAAGRARFWFLLSAWSGAAGLWLSAATQILVFIGVGGGAAVAILVSGPGEADAAAVAHPELWRTWGRWGAGLALGFYALEYFPSHLAMHLEINHPLYAAAWWGAGELLAGLAAWRQAGESWWPRRKPGQLARVAAFLALVAPLAAIAVGGVAWFRMLDPLFRLLPSLVIEGESLLQNIRNLHDPWVVTRDLVPLGTLLLLGLSAAVKRHSSRVEFSIAIAAVLAVAPMAVAGWWQNRWILVLFGLSPVFVVTSLLAWRSQCSPRVGTLIVGGLIAGLAAVFPRAYLGYTINVMQSERLTLSEDDVYMASMRHYAHELRVKAGSQARPIVVASPNDSTPLAYYGGLRTVGTLYWENLDGLRDAATIYGTPDAAKAKALFVARGVTYLFSCPPGNFAEGYAALASGTLDPIALQRSFAAQVLVKKRLPVWLQPVWLAPPSVVDRPPRAACLAFAPNQTEAEQRENIARFQREATPATAKP